MLIDGLRMRRVMGRNQWRVPVSHGSGWRMSHVNGDGNVIATWYEIVDDDGVHDLWIHASMSRRGRVPSYEDLKRLHRAVFPGWAYSVWAPPSEHVNLHEHVLHIFGPVDGLARLPDFTFGKGII
jgi:hypothetical protein